MSNYVWPFQTGSGGSGISTIVGLNGIGVSTVSGTSTLSLGAITPTSLQTNDIYYPAGLGGNVAISLNTYFINSPDGAHFIDLSNRRIENDSGVVVADFSLSTLHDNSNIDSLDWQNRYLQYSGQTSLDWGNYYTIDSAGNTSIDWNNRLLTLGDNSTVDWYNCYLQTTSGIGTVNSVEWANFTLYDSSNILAQNWLSRQLFDTGGNGSVDYNNRLLFDYESGNLYPTVYFGTQGGTVPLALLDSNGVSLEWDNRFLADNGGEVSLFWNNRTLVYTDGTTIVANWGATILTDYTNGNSSIDWTNRNLYDHNGSQSILYDYRYLIDSSGNIGIDWDNRVLVDAAANGSADWNNRLLYDSTGQNSIRWDNRITYDSSGNESIDYSNRFLVNSGTAGDPAQTPSLDWQNNLLITTAQGAPTTSVDWYNCYSYDQVNGYLSIDWNSRILYESNGSTPILNWSNAAVQLPYLALSGSYALYADSSNNVLASSVTLADLNTLLGINTSTTIQAQISAISAGISWKNPVTAATTSALPTNTYNNGSSGVGATLTASSNGAFPTVDGQTVSLNGSVLIQNESTQSHNGIYTLTTAGSGSTAWVLTRRSDSNSSSSLTGATCSTLGGTTYPEGTIFTQQAVSPTVGTTAITFVESATGVYSASGQGITLSAGVFSLQLDGSTLSQSVSGVKVATGGITNNEINSTAAIAFTKLAAQTAYSIPAANSSGFLASSPLYYNGGYFGFNTNAPTNTITLGSTSNGIAAFNTSDQTTNFASVTSSWQSSIYNIVSAAGGTVTNPLPIQFSLQSTTGSTGYRQFTIYDVTGRPFTGAGIFDFTNLNSSVAGATNAMRGIYSGSSTFQQTLGIYPTVNQSSTASFSGFYMSPYIQTIGGSTLNLDLGYNSAANNSGTHTQTFSVDYHGDVVIGNTASSGITLFNTSDRSTNYEKLQAYWNSNIFKIGTSAGGTGTTRSMQFFSGNRVLSFNASVSSTVGVFDFNHGNPGAALGNSNAYTLTGSNSASTGIFSEFALLTQSSQTSTATWRGMWVSPYLASLGGTANLLVDLGTNTAANGAGTHTSKFTVDISGNSVGNTHANKSLAYSTLPSSPLTGMQAVITDSTVNTWGTTVTTGGGSYTVMIWYNGSNWKVYGA